MGRLTLSEGQLRAVVRKLIAESVSGYDVREIFKNTNRARFETTLNTRNPSGTIQAGSKFETDQTYESLIGADWKPYSNPNITGDAVAFTAPIPGFLGAIPIDSLPPTTPVKFQVSHGGEGGQSGSAAEVVAVYDNSELEEDFTTLIAGPSGPGGSLVVWTFHPGPPSPPTPKGSEILMGDILAKFPTASATIADARALGFNFVKRVDSLR